eukprot:CAMPEP_0113293906 /NCGR_PEP_ID=MMETSP0008_2-20120614/35609_1 /TAXON_ID=97485 /ORGANISM="Prymnesium parvum" /LENGTH=59 /DNA_ID=CAMNT_0000146471 /DNA_START=402 /DNA_END=578 /DNA_ORIENTATION=+ /assembly_acc=CAM_ASM_000153
MTSTRATYFTAEPAGRTCTREKFSTTCALVTMQRQPGAACAASGWSTSFALSNDGSSAT